MKWFQDQYQYCHSAHLDLQQIYSLNGHPINRRHRLRFSLERSRNYRIVIAWSSLKWVSKRSTLLPFLKILYATMYSITRSVFPAITLYQQPRRVDAMTIVKPKLPWVSARSHAQMHTSSRTHAPWSRIALCSYSWEKLLRNSMDRMDWDSLAIRARNCRKY